MASVCTCPFDLPLATTRCEACALVDCKLGDIKHYEGGRCPSCGWIRKCAECGRPDAAGLCPDCTTDAEREFLDPLRSEP